MKEADKVALKEQIEVTDGMENETTSIEDLLKAGFKEADARVFDDGSVRYTLFVKNGKKHFEPLRYD